MGSLKQRDQLSAQIGIQMEREKIPNDGKNDPNRREERSEERSEGQQRAIGQISGQVLPFDD